MSSTTAPARGYAPDYALPPGDTLAETLEEIGMTQADLARRTGLSTKHVNQIVAGSAPISPETALGFERVTNVPARFWLNLEAAFRERLARRASLDVRSADVQWARRFPIAALAKRSALRRCSDGAEQLAEVLQFLGVASPAAWDRVIQKEAMAYRKARTGAGEATAQAAWLRIGEIRAGQITTRPYEQARFLSTLEEIRSLTQIVDPAEWLPVLTETCALAGVAVVVEPELPRTGINGVARWLGPERALVQLSARHRWLDVFWFSFFHEAGHLALHAKRGIFIDGHLTTKDHDPHVARMEREADEFAARLLIPRRFDAELATLSVDQVPAFAERVGIGPWIVLGRLKHDGRLAWNAANHLRPRLELEGA